MHPDPVALVALSPSLTAVLDADGVPRYLSPSAAALFDTVHPDDTTVLETAFAEAVRHPGRAVPVHFRAHAGGRMRHLAGQFLNRVEDPRVGGVVLHLTDVSSESTLAVIARDFMDRGQHDLDACVVDALAALADLADADRAAVFHLRENGLAAELTHEWCRDPSTSRAGDYQNVPLDLVPRLVELLLDLRTTVINIAERPEFVADAAAIGAADTRSCALAPLIVDGRLVGCVALEFIGRERAWQPATLSILDQFAPVLSSALERRRIEREFRDAQTRFEQAWKHAPIGMVMLSREGELLRVNPAFCELLGYSERELLGAPFPELLYPDDLREYEANVARLDAGESDRLQLELRFGRRVPGESGEDGTWCRVSLSLVRDDDRERTYLIGQIEDVTQRREFEARLAYEATHDALTGLPQRNSLLESLERALAAATRRGDNVAVLFIDVDNFKRVNDTLGHAAGDELLQSFAGRLSRAVRASDMAARLGGDEFVVMCTDLADPRQVVRVAQRILRLVEQPFRMRGVEVFVGASIGIAVAEPGVDAATLLRHADTAAYRAKDRGRNRYEIFDDELRAAVAHRLETETALRRAIEDDEQRLHFQPIIDVSSGRVTAFEALGRWDDDRQGSERSHDFQTIAEETGLVVAIGKRLIHDACEQLARWQRTFRDDAPGIAVNISARQLAHPSLLDDTRAALRKTGARAADLTFEISESVLMDDTQASIARLEELRALGVCIAIDDFGAGYSSLSYLRRLPVDAIKINHAFVVELGIDHDGSTIVAAVINLAHALGLDIAADGVESIEHVAALVALGCDRMQGGYFSVPLNEAEATEMVRRPVRQDLPGPNTSST